MAADGRWLDRRTMLILVCVCFFLQSTLKGANLTVFACLNHGMPLFLRENSSLICESGTCVVILKSVLQCLLLICCCCCFFFPSESAAGFFLSVNTSVNITKLRIPYPQTGTWYLSLRSLCGTEHGWDKQHGLTGTNRAILSTLYSFGRWLDKASTNHSISRVTSNQSD